VILDVIGEEIKGILTIDREHGKDVCGVGVVAEKFDGHGWSKVRRLSVRRLGHRKAGVAGVGTTEHASVAVTTEVFPFDLGNTSLSMDGLGTAAVLVARQLIAGRVEHWSHVNDQSL